MLFLYVQLWLDDTLRWIEELMRDGINSTIITVVFSAILAVVVAVIIWVIRIAEGEFLMIWKKIKVSIMMKRKFSGLQDAVYLKSFHSTKPRHHRPVTNHK